jgi:hypothetical protein
VTAATELDDLSLATTSLLLGAVYSEDTRAWRAITDTEPRVREFVRTLGLRLVIDRADGYALLRTEEELPEGLPRLIRRHALTLHATVLLILLRQRMFIADTAGDVPRIVLPGSELIEMLRIYHRPGTTEERILRDVNLLENLGYLRKLNDEQSSFEARRIIKAIMTAEWLAGYQAKVLSVASGDNPDISDEDNADLSDVVNGIPDAAAIDLTRSDGGQIG